jgi:mono/diheme cytochrome c family protein
MKLKKTWILTLLLAMAISGCERKPEPAKPPQSAPPPVQKASAETKATYQWYCAQCHGIEGKGDGVNAHLLTVRPRNHTEAEYLESRSDDELFRAIKLGGVAVGRAPCMPKWGHTLDDDTIHGLVLYVRELCQCKGS